MRKGVAAVLLGGIILGTGMTAHADEIIFNNGDRLSGKIESADGGKLVITSKIAGKVTVDLKDVKTFSTDDPLKVKLTDGTVIDQPIVSSTQPGTISPAPGGVLQPQPVPINEISKINEPPSEWTGALVVNGLLTSGNSRTAQLGITANVVRKTEQDRILADGGYLYGSSRPQGGTSTTTEDNEYFDAEYDYNFTKKFFGYASTRVEKDRINLLDLRLTPGVGVGYHFYDQPDFHLEGEGGLAWVYEKFSNVSQPREDFSARLAYHIDKGFWDNHVKIYHDLQVFPSIENIKNFLLITDVGLRTDLTAKMFTEIKAVLNYDSNPAPGSVRTTTKFLLGVGWIF